MRFEVGEWVESQRVNGRKPFVAQIIAECGEDYILRDSARRKWLRRPRDLKPISNPEK